MVIYRYSQPLVSNQNKTRCQSNHMSCPSSVHSHHVNVFHTRVGQRKGHGERPTSRLNPWSKSAVDTQGSMCLNYFSEKNTLRFTLNQSKQSKSLVIKYIQVQVKEPEICSF